MNPLNKSNEFIGLLGCTWYYQREIFAIVKIFRVANGIPVDIQTFALLAENMKQGTVETSNY